MAMDEAYEGDETRACVKQAGFAPVVPPKQKRKEPWDYDAELYKRRNEVERLFRKLKSVQADLHALRKVNVMFKASLYLALARLILFPSDHAYYNHIQRIYGTRND